MVTYGEPMGTLWDLWIGDLWRPVGTYRAGLFGRMGISAYLWGVVGTYASLWGPLGTHWDLGGPKGASRDLC